MIESNTHKEFSNHFNENNVGMKIWYENNVACEYITMTQKLRKFRKNSNFWKLFLLLEIEVNNFKICQLKKNLMFICKKKLKHRLFNNFFFSGEYFILPKQKRNTE